MREHADSFDLLRLVAAALVFWSHQHALLGIPEPLLPFTAATQSLLGLYIFFAISGYLNAHSLLRSQSLSYFAASRVLRIYPALTTCIILCVVWGAILTTAAGDYWNKQTWLFFVKNVTLFNGVRYELPGVFTDNPFPRAVNGSLWTLPHEVKLYLALGLVMAVTRVRSFPFVFACGAGIALLTACFYMGFAPFWVHFALLFAAGAAIAGLQTSFGSGATMGVVCVVVVFGFVLHNYAGILLIAATVIILVGRTQAPAFLRPPIDISYGVYIYAFPVQQTVAMVVSDFWVAAAVSFMLTIALAVGSALLIERPALRLKARFRSSSIHGAPLLGIRSP
jgi:peptidoglycan/LPS O-acetylase OafA/YrhL